eukprot:jgi/Chlat1/3654/Chrsp238S03635
MCIVCSVTVSSFAALSNAFQDDTVGEIVVNGDLAATSTLTVSRKLTVRSGSNGTASLVGDFRGVMLLVDTGGELLMSTVDVSNGDARGSNSPVVVQGVASFVRCKFYSNKAAASGGAIHNAGTLTLSQLCTRDEEFLLQGQGGALYDEGEAIITDCTFNGNSADATGGSISSTVSLTLTGSTFSNNEAVSDSGGALEILGHLVAENCTFDSNTASNYGGHIITQEGAALTARNCNFSSGYAYDGGAVELNSNATFENCHFNGNAADDIGGAIDQYVGYMTLRECRFVGNSAILAGGAISSAQPGFIADSVFVRNLATDSEGVGGAIHADENSNLDMLRCNFTANNSTFVGGAIRLGPAVSDGSPGVVSLRSCNFINNGNFATYGGAIGVSELGRLIVNDCYFDGNFGNFGGTIYVDGTINLNNSIIVNSRGSLGSLGIPNPWSAARISRSTFEDNEAERGGAIECVNGPSVQVEDTIFSRNVATNEDGGAIALRNCTFRAARCNFTANASLRSAGAISIGSYQQLISATATIAACNFVNNSAKVNGGAITSSYKLSITDSTFDGNDAADGGAIRNTGLEEKNEGLTIVADVYVPRNLLTVTQCTFRNNFCSVGSEQTGGAIQNGFGSIIVTDTTFINNTAQIGGGFHNGGRDTVGNDGCRPSMSALIQSCTFVDNTAGQGGGAAVDASACEPSANVTFRNVTFLRNIAGDGGALYLLCHNDTTCPVIAKSTLAGNRAQDGGGAAVFCDALPTVFCSPDGARLNSSAGCSTWSNNTATDGYGDVFASGPRALRASQTRFPSQASQQPLSNLSLQLVDQFGQVVLATRYDGTIINAQIANGSGILLGEVVTALSGGQAVFTNLNVNGTPGANELVLSADRSQLALDVPVVVDIRSCIRGEVTSADGTSCDRCSPPNFSWDPATPCTQCPENAICYGGDVIVPQDGFWRSSYYSAEIVECPNVEACTYANRSELLNVTTAAPLSAEDYRAQLCSKGYTGNLCAVCAEGYGLTRFVGKTQCRKCPSTAVKVIYMILWILVEVAIVSILITSTLMPTMVASTGQLLNGPAGMKIVINLFQVVALAFVIQHEWPAPIDYMTETLATVFLAQSQLLPLDCYMSNGGLSKAFRTTIIYSVLPFAATLPAILFWSIYHWYLQLRQRKVMKDADADVAALSFRTTFWERIMPSMLCIEFFLWPTTVANFLSLFSCRYIDSAELFPGDPVYNPDQVLGLHWESDMSVKCFTGTHLAYVLGFGIPGLFIFVALLPASIGWFVYKNRNRLNQLRVLRRTGFFFKMYRPKAFLWDEVLHFQKLLLAINSILIAKFGGQAQNAIAFGVLTAFTLLQWHVQPHIRTSHERLTDSACCAACYLVFMGMLVFLYPSHGPEIAIDVLFGGGLGICLAFFLSKVAFGAVKDVRALHTGGFNGRASLYALPAADVSAHISDAIASSRLIKTLPDTG